MNASTRAVLAVFAAAAMLYAAARVVREVRLRRADRAWAEGVAQSVHDRLYLEWLEREFASEERKP